MTARLRRSIRLSAKSAIATTICALLIAVLSGSGSGGSAQAASLSKSPLTFGVLGTFAGPSGLPEFQEALQAFVNNWNRKGGFQGHPILLKSADAGSTSSSTAAAAHQLIASDHVLAVAGSAIPDCLTNASYYASSGVPDITVSFADPQCNVAPYIFPIEGLDAMFLSLGKWSALHGAKRVGYVGLDIPGNVPLVSLYKSLLAKTPDTRLVYSDLISPTATAADIQTIISQMKAAHVDTVIGGTVPPQQSQLLTAGVSSGFGPTNGIKWVLAGSFYSPNVIASFGNNAEGLYVGCWAYCFQDKANSAVQSAHRILTAAHVSPLDGNAQWGYIIGELLQAALSRVHGNVTSASIEKALSSFNNVHVGMLPYGLTFTGAVSTKHPRNIPSGVQMSEIQNGAFVIKGNWIPFGG